MTEKYVLKDTLTYTIEKLNHSIYELQSRVSECESQIAQLNNQAYNIQLGRNLEIKSKMDELATDFKDLKYQIAGDLSELRANLDALVVKPNKKSNLEILEQNSGNELKYINIDDEDKNNFWYWNGETWK